RLVSDWSSDVCSSDLFTDFGASPGHTLALMRFSIATRAASAYQSLYSTTTQFVGWPAFLPDGSAVVFTQGDASDFSGLGVGLVRSEERRVGNGWRYRA